MNFVDLLSPRRVALGVHATSKKRLLETVAALLNDGGDAEREIYDSLCARERLGSTGLGQGVAIPHGRTAAVGSASAAFVRLAEPIDFNTVDQQPVDMLFALVVPEHFTDQHLILLSQLAEMLSEAGFCRKLREAADSAALLRLLQGWEAPRPAAQAG
ncbi:MAG TPA: PTS sugar transporter subunit IIA [Xanthomonadaceae bacterium]|nr:PTS sugar transporter subunit IIA [Xanthomonadaceae bacterium]